jgi:hypothetical protein
MQSARALTMMRFPKKSRARRQFFLGLFFWKTYKIEEARRTIITALEKKIDAGAEMGDDQEFAVVGSDEIVPELIVKEGEDIDYRVVMVFYLLADLGSIPLFFFQPSAIP